MEPKSKDLTSQVELNLKVRSMHSQFDVMQGLTVLRISLATFSEVTQVSRNNKDKLSMYVHILKGVQIPLSEGVGQLFLKFGPL